MTNVNPSLPELRRKVETAGGRYAQTHGTAREIARRDLSVAQIAYHAGKALDTSPIPITREQAEYLCSVIASRVAEQ